MSSALSLSEIQQWSPNDMDALHDHLNELANRRGNTMDAIQSSANNLVWTGAGHTGMKTAIAGHAATATSEAQILRATAAVAKTGGQTLYGQQQGILNTVEQAQSAEFEVGDDLMVTDPKYDGTIAGLARQGIAQGIQADLMTQAGAFTGQRMATATGITSSVAGLGGTSAADSHAGVQMVDNKFKTDGPLPAPVPPGPPVNNGPVQTPWPPAGGAPASVANPQRAPTPPIVIAEHPPEKTDPQDHDCSIRQIVDGAGEVLGGSATAAAGGVGVVAGVTAEAPSLGSSTIPIIAGVGGIATGAKLITDGIDDLGHCTNQIVPGAGK
jgi:hypothetical protein